jgi:hypothetical protein
MFEEWVPSAVVLLVTVMLVTLIVLAIRLESLGRRYYVADVVGIMSLTSVITACLVGLFVVFLTYGPVGRAPHYPGYVVVTVSEHDTTRDEEDIGAATSPTETEGIVTIPPGQSEQHPTCAPIAPNLDGLSAREVSGEGQ